MTKDLKLSSAARELISDPDNALLLPTIVLAEVVYLGKRLREAGKLAQAIAALRAAPNVAVIPFDEGALEFLTSMLDIHDSVIVASALSHAARSGEPVTVVTKDARIADCGLVECLW